MNKIKIRQGKNTIYLNVKEASFLGKVFGLMFKSRNADNLLFDFKKSTDTSIHSLFVFFSFLVIWLDDKNHVIGRAIARPFQFHLSCPVKFTKIIELPFNKNNYKTIEFFVGKRKI